MMKLMKKTVLKPREVDNPYFSRAHEEDGANPSRILAMVNVKESAINSLEARGKLTPSQVKAANIFRRYWERLGGAGAKALDYTREPVDGGGNQNSAIERFAEAGKQLNACRDLLGMRNYALVRQVCGEGYSFADLTSGRRERDTLADNLRTSLDDLCMMWGLSTNRERKHGIRSSSVDTCARVRQ